VRLHITLVFLILTAAPAVAGNGWQTTVIRAANETNAGDLGWSTTVVAARADPITTGSIARDGAYRPAVGPRLTGVPHALAGSASYYWQEQMTATGERFNKRAMTAAHKTLPFGTRVRVTRADTGRSVIVRINDRGPYKPGRIIDLSEKAAEDLGMTGVGVTPVKLEVLGK
jgi:rare lipoprotein A